MESNVSTALLLVDEMPSSPLADDVSVWAFWVDLDDLVSAPFGRMFEQGWLDPSEVEYNLTKSITVVDSTVGRWQPAPR